MSKYVTALAIVIIAAGCPSDPAPSPGGDDSGATTDAPPVDPTDTSAGGPDVAAEDVPSQPDAGAEGDTPPPPEDVDPPDPSSYPNVSEVFGYPYTSGSPPALDPAFAELCGEELPNASSPFPPGPPATPNNCAGDPTKCGSEGKMNCGGAVAKAKWLHRLTLDTAQFPDAVCNDGSPGLIEVRPGSGDGANRWLIWFKGGSSCRNQHVCAKRWCGNQSGTTYDAAIMSNDWNGDGQVDRPHCVRGETGSSLDPDLVGNPFANANIVKVWYCGSDNHMGRAVVGHEDLDGDGDGVARSFSVHAKGRRIVEAALAVLDAGATSDDGAVTMPSLKDATFVVVSGSSAGSFGAMNNMDAIHEHIAANAPGVIVRGVLDANAPPSDEVYDAAGVYVDAAFDGMKTPGMLFSEWRRQNAVESWTGGWYKAADAFVDQSCLAAVQAGPGDAGMHACLVVSSFLQYEHGLSTETFVRFDLEDAVAGGIYKPCVHPYLEEPCYSPPHSLLAADDTEPETWLNLEDSSDHNRATMIQLFESGGSVTGIFSPNCGTHTGFTNKNFTAQIAGDYKDGAFGTPMSFMEALAGWLETGTPVRVIDASKSTPDPAAAVCNPKEG